MTDQILIEKSEKTGKWIEGKDSGGCVIHYGWDYIIKMLQSHPNVNLLSDEKVVRIRASKDDLKFWLE